MRVSLLRYMFFPVLPLSSGAPGSEWPPLPRQGAAFLGGPEWGSQNPEGAIREAEAPRPQGAGIGPKLCPELKGEQRKRVSSRVRRRKAGKRSLHI